MMSKLSHSNPYLDDVYVDGDEYRFENSAAYIDKQKIVNEYSDLVKAEIIQTVEDFKNSLPSLYKNFALYKLHELGINTTDMINSTVDRANKKYNK